MTLSSNLQGDITAGHNVEEQDEKQKRPGTRAYEFEGAERP